MSLFLRLPIAHWMLAIMQLDELVQEMSCLTSSHFVWDPGRQVGRRVILLLLIR